MTLPPESARTVSELINEATARALGFDPTVARSLLGPAVIFSEAPISYKAFQTLLFTFFAAAPPPAWAIEFEIEQASRREAAKEESTTGGPPNASPPAFSSGSWGGLGFLSRPPTISLMGGSTISEGQKTIDFLSYGFARGFFGAATGNAPPGSTNFSETPNAPGRADDDDTGLVGPQGQGPTPPGTSGSLGDTPQSP